MACMNKGWEILSRNIKNCLKRKKGIENSDNNIAERWEILRAKNNWEGLFDPLDFDLRQYLIHYEDSKYRGTSRCSKKNLVTRVGLDKNNTYKYEITKYLYAASDVPSETEKVKQSNWMGFVGVATDEGKVALGRRDILIAWRGTVMVSEWNDDFENSLVQPTEIFGENTNDILVHKDQVLEKVKRLLNQYKEEEVSITVTGHSLGSSLSTLCAIDIVVNQINK
ncbi:hypothetical protein P3L10_005478 [Capsicum annuum]